VGTAKVNVLPVVVRTKQLTQKATTYVAKNYRYLRADPSFFVMKTLARFEMARALATSPARATFVPTRAQPAQAIEAKHTLDEIDATLRSEGYYVGLRLAPDILKELQDAVQSSPCYADRDPKRAFLMANKAAADSAWGRPIKLASYFDQQLQWPAFQAVQSDPLVLAIARHYLRRAPVFMRSEVFWTFAVDATRAEKRAQAQVFHCDINDFRTIKFFFHLSDVGPNNGPHEYITKGPQRRTLVHQMIGQRLASVPEHKLLRTYRNNQIVRVCGESGLGFAGDPYYIHKGSRPTEGSRLMMQLEFGCRSYRTWYFGA
jgi:hypothetical protein